MKNELKKCLSNLDEVDFIELTHALKIAQYARNVVKDFTVTAKEFQDKLNVSEDVFKSIVGGYYPYDIRFMAKLESYQKELEIKLAEENAKRLLEFPEYKDSLPVKYMTQWAQMIKKELAGKQ